MPAPDSFSSIGWLLIALAGLAGALNQGLGLIERFRPKPEAGEVERDARERFATKAECQRHHDVIEQRLSQAEVLRVADAKDSALSRRGVYEELKKAEKESAEKIAHLSKEMAEMERRLNHADEERSLALHTRLNEILAEVSELRGSTEHTRRKA